MILYAHRTCAAHLQPWYLPYIITAGEYSDCTTLADLCELRDIVQRFLEVPSTFHGNSARSPVSATLCHPETPFKREGTLLMPRAGMV